MWDTRLADADKDLFISFHILHKAPEHLQTKRKLPEIEFASDSGSEAVLHASGSEVSDREAEIFEGTSDSPSVAESERPKTKKSRAYKPRASHQNSCQVAGESVCQRAMARLLSVGTTKIERVPRVYNVRWLSQADSLHFRISNFGPVCSK